MPFLFLASLLSSGCSSDSNDNAPESKNEYNVETSDLYGTWIVSESTQDNLKGIKLVLDPKNTCTWIDKKNNDYVGPYYFMENVKDDCLRTIGSKLAVENLDRIHLGEAKVRNYISVRVATLLLTCDLYPFLADRMWIDFNDKVDYEEWCFWEFNTFSYEFDITKYLKDRLELLLQSSSIRYCSYPEKYPLRIQDGTKLILIKQ